MGGARRHLSLAARVARRTDALARRMVAAFVEQIPIYGLLPKEQLEGEIVEISRHNLRVFFEFVETGKLAEHDLDAVRASAARRAEERVPLEALLTAYHLGARMGWDALCDAAGDDDLDELLAAATSVMAYTEVVTGAVAAAYLEERQTIYGEERDARRVLAESLLSGEQAESLAERAGFALAEGYLVLALAIGRSPDERDTGVEGAVAARRKLRRVEQHLADACGDRALSLLNAGGGTVVMAVDPAEAPDRLAGASDLVAGLAAAAGAEITAGCSWHPGPEGAATAAAEAREVLRLAVELGRPPRAYQLDDLVLEYVLARPGDAADRLTTLLDPLESGPELIETLEGWFEADFDRREAAAALNIHPNTLDYRLKRVAELTGLSTSSAHGLLVLGAALTRRRLRHL